ncbi:MAG: cyanophycinase [Planctomycetota bacterium]
MARASACLATALFAAVALHAQDRLPLPKAPAPFAGSRVLAGNGKVMDCVLDAFLSLRAKVAAAPGPAVIVLAKSGKPTPALAARLKERLGTAAADGSVAVEVVAAGSRNWHRKPDVVQSLTTGAAVWLDCEPFAAQADAEVRALLNNVAARGGVLGAAGEVAQMLASEPFGVAASELHLSSAKSNRAKLRADRVHWFVPKQSALLLHTGRRACVYGRTDVDVRVVAANGWPERSAAMERIDAFGLGDVPGYGLDVMSWQRSAMERALPNYPPAKPAVPKVTRGALMLHGGGGVDEATFRRFLAKAGGKNAAIVCMPDAKSFDPGREPSSYSAGKLRDLGARNVTVLWLGDSGNAERAGRAHELLAEATGVWIDGGRTYRFMDVVQGTRVHDLLHDVLRRDGVVGGSSAGGQLIGDMLVRGNPRSNKSIMCEGYTRGLALLTGVVVDAHFLERDREAAFGQLVSEHPQMLGIGLDRDTGIWVEGSVAEVLGGSAVIFYDRRTDAGSVREARCEAGDRYDLAKGKKL